MGWCYSHRPTGQSEIEWIKGELPSTFASVSTIRQVGNVIYGLYTLRDDYAATQTEFLPCPDGKVRIALVVLIGHAAGDYYNTGYKDMTESCGPCEATCPNTILDQLSTIREGAESYARKWRERCREHNAKSKEKAGVITEGATIELALAPQWSDGYQGLRYTVECLKVRSRNKRKTTLLRAVETGMLYRVPSNIMDYQPRVVA